MDFYYIPADLWRMILLKGVSKCNFVPKDLCSIALTCKFFDKVVSDDSIWSPLLVSDSTEEEELGQSQEPDLLFSASARTRVLLRFAKNKYTREMKGWKMAEDSNENDSLEVELDKINLALDFLD